MIVIFLKVEELPDGSVGVAVDSKIEGTNTEKELEFGRMLNSKICHALPQLLEHDWPCTESIVADTPDQKLNHSMIAALRKRHERPPETPT